MRHTAGPHTHEHWRNEQFRVTREACAVDPDNRTAIEAHTEKLRAELDSDDAHRTDTHGNAESTAVDDLRAVFDQDVCPFLEAQRVHSRGDASWPPVLVYTGGQPGVGKSRAIERTAQSRPSLLPIIGDDLRQFHPDYVRLMREAPLAMPETTAQASGSWIGMSAECLRNQRADVLIETTLRSPDAMTRTIASFRDAGYVIELRVVAVPEAVSRLSTVERYTGQVEAAGAGRWTPAAAHDEAYARATEMVAHLIEMGSVDRFVIEDRTGAVHYDESYFGVRDDGLRFASKEAATAFADARAIDQMTPEAARAWIELADRQVALLRELRQDDPDLLATVERITTTDASAIADRASTAPPRRISAPPKD